MNLPMTIPPRWRSGDAGGCEGVRALNQFKKSAKTGFSRTIQVRDSEDQSCALSGSMRTMKMAPCLISVSSLKASNDPVATTWQDA